MRSMPSSSCGRTETCADLLRHLRQQPDVPQLRLILGLGLEQELRKTLESSALLDSIARRDETVPEVRPVPGFTDEALGCALTRPATRPLHGFPPAGTLVHS
jgi:hypothetical protein